MELHANFQLIYEEMHFGEFIKMLQSVYGDFGFDDVIVKLSTRPEKRLGSDETWDRAEAALAQALDKKGLQYDLQPGEAVALRDDPPPP